MLILNSSDVRASLPMKDTIEAMKSAFAALERGHAQIPLRVQLPIPPHEAVSLFMPAFVDQPEGQALAVKVVSVYPHNLKNNLPLIHAAVLVLKADTGQPIAILEGGTLTAIRTGAATGAATDLLARQNSHVAAIFGAGVQARTQLEAVCNVRDIQQVWIYDLNNQAAESMKVELAGQSPIPSDIRIASSPTQAVVNADVICTATTSKKPVFEDQDLKPGVHINGVGSYTPEMQEIPATTVARSKVIVDQIEAALTEAGDLIQPLHSGVIQKSQIHLTLGAIVLGKQKGRLNIDETTFFKSVGNAVQDAAAATLAIHNATLNKRGQFVDW